MSELRALTVHRPWSYAIADLGKDIENRSRAINYRGVVAIHGGKVWSLRAEQWIRDVTGRPFNPDDTTTFGRGIIALAEIAGCHESVLDFVDGAFQPGCCDSPWAMVEPGRTIWHVELANVRPLREPIPCKGFLGLWRVPDDVAAAIEGMK